MPEKEYKLTEELETKEGYIKDFLTNRLIRLTPEELNRLKKDNYPIFMAVVEKAGYDLNSKTPKIMFK